jgi:hypothetical protein
VFGDGVITKHQWNRPMLQFSICIDLLTLYYICKFHKVSISVNKNKKTLIKKKGSQ